MSTEADLLRAVLDAPEDVAVRRAYGKVLADRGDPRGEFIHVQCELAEDACDRSTRTALLRREAQLLGKHHKAWIAPISGAARTHYDQRVTFQRGMVERVFARAEVLARNASDIAAREPVTDVALVDLSHASAEALAAGPLLQRVRNLRASASERRSASSRGFFTRRTFPSLTELDFGPRLSGTEVVSEVLMDPLFDALSGMTLHGDDMLKELFARLPSSRLRSVGFRRLKARDSEFNLVPRAIAAIEGLALDHVDLANNLLDAEDLESLSRAPFAPRLTRLHVGFAAGVPRTQLRTFEGVEQLELTMSPRAELPVAAWPKLRHLALFDCPVDVAEAIGQAPWALRSLHVTNSDARIAPETVRAFSTAKWRSTLRELVLPLVDDATMLALSSAEWPELERIRVRGPDLTAGGVSTLATANMPSLTYVEIGRPALTAESLKPLRKRLGPGLTLVPLG